MKTSIGLIHTSPVAIPPLAEYYQHEAPEYQITNLLDDGVLRYFSSNDEASIERSIGRMIATARDEHNARLVLVTCSALSRTTHRSLQRTARIPVLKIDEPMARCAVQAGRKIGVAATFEPTVEPTRRLLWDAADGQAIDLEFRVIPAAYAALRNGEAEAHDRFVLEGVEELAKSGVDCIVLAQVSMARVLSRVQKRCSVPVFTSLETSLAAVRQALEGAK
jgi:glutamate racemase